MSTLATIILAKNHSAGQILRMPEWRKTRVYFEDGTVAYFPDDPAFIIDETESTHITILYPKEWVHENIPHRHIVMDEVQI